jgi:hypothetical protein
MYLDNIFINYFNNKLKQKQVKVLAEVIALSATYTSKVIFAVCIATAGKNMNLLFMLKTAMSVNLKPAALKTGCQALV